MTLHTATVVNPQSSLPVKSEDSYNQVIPGAVPNVFNRQYHTLEAGKYILPCDEEEKGRLNLQHSNFVDLFDGLLLSSARTHLRPGSRVIDFACGTGAWILDMAKAYPDSTFIGADIADVFPKDDLPPNVSFSIIDISKPLPFEENSFDLINSRLIIISIQEDRWPTMLKEWHRMVKPGGLVQLMEYDHLASNGNPITNRFVLGLYGAMKKNKQDFFVSNKLPALLRCSGFDVLEKDSRNIELKADGTELSKRIVENWIRAMLGFKPFILPFICPENPDLYDSLLEENVNACIEQGWFKRAIGVVGRKPLV